MRAIQSALLCSLLVPACTQTEELDVEPRKKNLAFEVHEGESADSPDCLIWEVSDGSVSDPDGEPIVDVVGDDITDPDGNVLCTVTNGALGPAVIDSSGGAGGAPLFTLQGNKVHAGDATNNGSGNPGILYTYAGKRIHDGHVSDGAIAYTATTSLASEDDALKLALVALAEGECTPGSRVD